MGLRRDGKFYRSTCLSHRVPRHLAKHDLGVSVMVFGGVWIQESEYREPPLVQGSPTAHQRHEGIKGQGGKGHCPFGGGGREECQRDAREKGFYLDSSCSDLRDRAKLCGERPCVRASSNGPVGNLLSRCFHTLLRCCPAPSPPAGQTIRTPQVCRPPSFVRTSL